jgi:hypothetical protein
MVSDLSYLDTYFYIIFLNALAISLAAAQDGTYIQGDAWVQGRSHADELLQIAWHSRHI